MKLTLKENMILNKVIGDYVIDNNLFFDECRTLNKIVNKLKEERREVEHSEEAKQRALKELSLYDIKSMCNKKWFGAYNKKELIKDLLLIIVLITIALGCYNLT